jgi:hypothetical protein
MFEIGMDDHVISERKKKDNKTHLCRHPEHAQACSVKTQKAQPTFKHKLKVAFTLK